MSPGNINIIKNMPKSWKEYENQVFEEFRNRYPNQTIELDQKLKGRYSEAMRQVDVLIKTEIADSIQIGVFDCKMFNKKVDVKVIDSMVGFMDDLNANYGGIITCIGFSKAAEKRAKASNIKLDIVKFESPDQVVNHFVPSLDFSDVRNSMYIPLIF